MRTYLFVTAVAACCASARAFVGSLQARSFAPTSRFGTPNTCTAAPARTGAASLTMKRKGKPQQGIQGRGAYSQQQQQQEAMAAQKREMAESGNPVFEMYVRTKLANIWFPAGSMVGDEKSKTMVEAWMGGLFSDFYKGNLDRGVAMSLAQKKGELVNQICQMYPDLSKQRGTLQFGYKISYKGLEEKLGQQKIEVITDDMKRGFFDKLKDNIPFLK